jgi:hypothetical protein
MTDIDIQLVETYIESCRQRALEHVERDDWKRAIFGFLEDLNQNASTNTIGYQEVFRLFIDKCRVEKNLNEKDLIDFINSIKCIPDF